MKLEVESMTQLQSVLTENDGVVVTFTQPRTCVPCRRVKPHLDKLAEQRDDLTIAIVDLDTVPDAMVEYSIQSVPTLMLFQNGEYVKHLEARTVIKLNQEI